MPSFVNLLLLCSSLYCYGLNPPGVYALIQPLELISATPVNDCDPIGHTAERFTGVPEVALHSAKNTRLVDFQRPCVDSLVF